MQSVSSIFVEPATNMDTMASATAQLTIQGVGLCSNALDIVHEMADRERMKNIISQSLLIETPIFNHLKP